MLDQEPAPPSRLNAKVPRDLETICLKCLEKDPHRRYATARALADDLRAWLEGRPMAARRVGAAERAWLWCRRRPAIAALAAAVVLAVVGGTATTIAVQAAANGAGRKNNELVETLGREAAANRRVEQRYELAVEAIKTFHTGVSEDFLLKQDQFKELRDRLLKSAADFYGKLGALLAQETDLASRRALAASNFELAELTGKVGRTEDALAAHRAVLAAREALAAEPGADAAAKADVGRSLTAVAAPARSDREDGRGAGGLPAVGVAAGGPGAVRPAAQAALADAGRGWAACWSQTGPRPLRGGHEAARADRGAWPPPDRDIKAAVELATAWTCRPFRRRRTAGRGAGRVRRGWRSRASGRGQPAVADHRLRLAHLTTHLGFLLSTTGKPSEAEAEYRAGAGDPSRSWPTTTPPSPNSAAAWRTATTPRHPAVADGQAGGGGGRVPPGAGDPARSWPTTTPPSPNSAATWRAAITTSAMVLAATGQAAEAEAEYRRAVAISGSWPKKTPPSPNFRCCLANHHNALGILLSQTGRPAEAEAEYRRALAIRREAGRRQPRRHRIPQPPGEQPQQPRQPADGDGQAGGGGGRVPHGAGDPAEAGRRQPRRHRIPQRPGGQPQQPRHPAVADGPAGGGGGRVPPRRWRSCRSWPTTTPPSPNSAATWRSATTTSATCCAATGQASEAEAEYRAGDGDLQKLADDNPAVTEFRSCPGDQPQQPRHPAVADGQAGGGGGRVPRALAI